MKVSEEAEQCAMLYGFDALSTEKVKDLANWAAGCFLNLKRYIL
jgi:hypothetical protein